MQVTVTVVPAGLPGFAHQQVDLAYGDTGTVGYARRKLSAMFDLEPEITRLVCAGKKLKLDSVALADVLGRGQATGPASITVRKGKQGCFGGGKKRPSGNQNAKNRVTPAEATPASGEPASGKPAADSGRPGNPPAE